METKDIENRSNDFAENGKSNNSWALNQIIRFLHFQKGRVERKEITAATLKNFINSLKVFCDSSDLDIPWKKVTRGLPKGRHAASLIDLLHPNVSQFFRSLFYYITEKTEFITNIITKTTFIVLPLPLM